MISGLVFLSTALAFASALKPWWVQGIFSILAGLLIVRVFILYHDYLHRAILKNSKVAEWIFRVFGWLILTPPTVWRQTHNYHHAHTAKIVGSHVGSYAMVTTEMWRDMTPGQRAMYRTIRHPLTIALGYFTVFAWGMCVASFSRNPKKNWDSLGSLLLHVAIGITLQQTFGWGALIFAMVLPMMVACATGSYLFYAQHNYVGIHVQPRETWSYTRAALESSSFMKLGPVMNWFTGNIGYHHVHHLNPSIPFYRLPEAMRGIPELQNPATTTLRPKDVVASFRLKLWDPDHQQMVGYPRL